MGVGHDFVHHFRNCTEAWLADTHPNDQLNLPFAFTTQFNFGWSHLMFGRIHHALCDHIHDIYTRTGIKREAQRFLTLLIHRIWTKILRPTWNARNQKVHALDSKTSQTRIHLDTIVEAEELYNSTNVEMLPHKARQLFDDDLDVIISRPYHSLRAWCDSVEIEVLREASQHVHDLDDQQQLLNSHLRVPNTTSHQRKRLPTSTTDPLLSPIQLHIKRRRCREHNKSIPQNSASNLNPSLPHFNPTHNDAPTHQPPVPPPRRRRQRRRLRLQLTPRVLPPPPREQPPPLGIDHGSTLGIENPPEVEQARTRMLRGSWRPP